MAILKSAKNINIIVKDEYFVKAGKLMELSKTIKIEAIKGTLSISSNKKIQIHGHKK